MEILKSCTIIKKTERYLDKLLKVFFVSSKIFTHER